MGFERPGGNLPIPKPPLLMGDPHRSVQPLFDGHPLRPKVIFNLIELPVWQKSRGRLILTAALELLSNQVTHFYSPKKNTDEMIKLLEVLLKQYKNEDRIFFSWDAASWHASKKLYEKVNEVNSPGCREINKTPIVKRAPFPSCAQFLNVIESIFSGMAKTIIHNSNYYSVEDCMVAIDRDFTERNQYFKENPRRAGNKLWGKEISRAELSESNNCKDPKYTR